ncbi:MAG: histidine kinase [Bacteroidaceae bacterium]|nr:histidine kinase [Bacteroidaceae bacterium]
MKISRRTTEYLIYFLFWGALILSPFWGINLKAPLETVDWDQIFKFWAYLSPALILFFINNNLLMPFLLYKKGGLHYLLHLICIMALVYFGSVFVASTVGRESNSPPHREMRHKPKDGRMRKGPAMEVYAKYYNVQATVHDFFSDNYSYQIKKHRPPKDKVKALPYALVHPDSVQILIIVFTLIFNICVRLFFLTLRSDEHLKELEKQKLRTELNFLKYQINPHFFMNTLNNIHALIDIDKDKAQESLIGLSKMMRHVLYEASASFVNLSKEIEFLNSYVELMRLRYTKALKVECSFPEQCEEYFVPSLLFVSFVENAFKHGVAYNGKSDIKIDMSVNDGLIRFSCSNSCVAGKKSDEKKSYSGIGIDNVRKRLSLIYGEDYSLEIKRDKKIFCVTLKIPVQNDKMYIS